MDHVIEEIKGCIEHDFHFAALALALTIPNVCASFEKQGKASGENYADWCNRYVKPELEIDGDIIYSLRCSFLHSVSADFYDELAFKKHIAKQEKSGEHRAQIYEFFVPHQDATKPVVCRMETDDTIKQMPCISHIVYAIIYGYKDFVSNNPEFTHRYDYLYFEG